MSLVNIKNWIFKKLNISLMNKKNIVINKNAGSSLNNENGDNILSQHNGDVINITGDISAQKHKSSLQDLNRFIADSETEKNDICSECKVAVHLSFKEPTSFETFEVKGTVCPSCKAPIVELRTFTSDTQRGLGGRITIQKKPAEWRKLTYRN